MIEKQKKSLDSDSQSSALLTDLSMAFDCIDHELMLAKFYAYSVDKNSLYFIHSYLSLRKQRTKTNTFTNIL